MFQHLLVPLDGSEYAERALKYASNLATVTGAEVTLLAVIEGTGSPASIVDPSPDPVRAQTSLEYLDEQAEQLQGDGGGRVSTRVVSGAPALAIVETARALPADLIIMSTEGLGAHGEFALGSVAMSVLQTAHCPVFMVRIDKPDPAQSEAEERWQAEGGGNVG